MMLWELLKTLIGRRTILALTARFFAAGEKDLQKVTAWFAERPEALS